MLLLVATFLITFVAYFVSHHVGDYVLQTDKISSAKVYDPERTAGRDGPRWGGWAANALHGLHHGVTALVFLLITAWTVGLPLSLLGTVASLAFLVGSHMFIDRRWPVRWLLEHTGSAKFAAMTTPIFGMFVTDQALHFVCIWIGSIIQATL